MVLEAIQKVAKYVVDYEPIFLYLFAKKNTLGRETTIRTIKTKIEKSKRRIKEIDMLIERIYEDNVLGKISDDRFYRMTANYEKEQKELLAAVEHGHKNVPIDIYFTAVGIINIPTEEELIAAMEEMREKPLKSA